MDKQTDDHRMARLYLTDAQQSGSCQYKNTKPKHKHLYNESKKHACCCKYLLMYGLNNYTYVGSIAVCSITYIPCLKPYITSKP